jgi:ABC-type glycerol-3-phosphate transport system permease component
MTDLLRLILPIGVLDFLFTWDDILLPPLFMKDRHKQTLVVSISTVRDEFI